MLEVQQRLLIVEPHVVRRARLPPQVQPQRPAHLLLQAGVHNWSMLLPDIVLAGFYIHLYSISKKLENSVMFDCVLR